MRYFYSLSLQKFGRRHWSDFPPEKFYFEIFFNAVSITFWLRYIHGQLILRPETQWIGFRETPLTASNQSNPYRNKPQDIIAQYAWLTLNVRLRAAEIRFAQLKEGKPLMFIES